MKYEIKQIPQCDIEIHCDGKRFLTVQTVYTTGNKDGRKWHGPNWDATRKRAEMIRDSLVKYQDGQ